MNDKDIYPLTIIKDRYSGAYSGGLFTAFNKDCWNVPEAIDAEDIPCHNFWVGNKTPIGVGDTPEKAIKDLQVKLKQDTHTIPSRENTTC